MTTYITNSDIQAYKNCRRDWWLGSVRNLVPATPWGDDSVPGSEAHKGTLVHHGLAEYYRTGNMTAAIASIPPALTYTVENVEYTDQNYAKDRELAVIMLEGYVEWLAETGADSTLETVGIEQEITVDVSEWFGADVALLGTADRLVRDSVTRTRRVMDHKTVGAISSDVWHIREQMLMYCLIERMTHPDEWADGAIINQLRKVKRTAKANPPFYGRQEIRFNDDEFMAFWGGLRVIIPEMMTVRRLLADGATPLQASIIARPNNDCSWKCSFKDVCPMFDDGSRVEDAIATHFKKRVRSRYVTIDQTLKTEETQR